MRHRDQLWVEALQEKNDTADDNMGRAKGEKDKDFLLKRQAKDYAGASSIHGLGYLAEEGRPQFEWFVVGTCAKQKHASIANSSLSFQFPVAVSRHCGIRAMRRSGKKSAK